MAINTARNEARLKKSEEQLRGLQHDQRSAIAKKASAEKLVDETLASYPGLDEKVENLVKLAELLPADASQEAKDAAANAIADAKSARESATECVKAQTKEITALDKEIARLAIDIPRLEAVVDAQRVALTKKAESYPHLLKRHLRKCRKYGWTDSRLAATK